MDAYVSERPYDTGQHCTGSYLILILISYMTFRYLGPQDTTVSVTHGDQTGLPVMFLPALKSHDFTI